MKRKNIISLSVAFAFLALSITGLLIFAKQDPHFVKINRPVIDNAKKAKATDKLMIFFLFIGD